MRIAHLSDLHLLDLTGAVPFRLLNKRFSGYVNLKLKRQHKHKLEVACATAKALQKHAVDHVVITGDVTTLALQTEFALVRRFLESELGFPPDQVSVVPGNHDAYTRGAFRAKRFEHYLAPYLTTDLPHASLQQDSTSFPFVRLRGPVAIIGLSSARPRPPLVASGTLGKAQRMALRSVLAHREVRARTPVLLQHHPPFNPQGTAATLLEGLLDLDEELAILAELDSGLLLHGHLHRRIQHTIQTSGGQIHSVGSTSTSLFHDDEHRMSGFNLYDVADSGHIEQITAFRLDANSTNYRETPIPERATASDGTAH